MTAGSMTAGGNDSARTGGMMAGGTMAGGMMERRLRAFLAGDTDGEDLLHALYSPVLDEPVPERLRALLRR
jgi:hypothetical protein